MVFVFQMPADESRIGNPLAVVIDVRQLALWCPPKAGVVDPVSKAGHFHQHLGLSDEWARIRETECKSKCVERDHRSLLESGCGCMAQSPVPPVCRFVCCTFLTSVV